MHAESDDAHAVWEEHYTAKPQVWSGRVNVQLAEIAGQLNGNRALDLGCGEGADAIWLAERGWTVVAVDVSTTALSRARAAAESRGMTERIDFQQHDLTSGFPPGNFDLVSAQFLHSTVEMDRTALLRRAAAVVAPGGTFLIVDHAAAPPWASKIHHHEFPTAETVHSALELDDAQWQRIQVGSVDRSVLGPDGQEATLVDNVIRLMRNPGQGPPRPARNG
jgi:ubiquinone/menaquinone biosynthesis C-methylase UbiE